MALTVIALILSMSNIGVEGTKARPVRSHTIGSQTWNPRIDSEQFVIFCEPGKTGVISNSRDSSSRSRAYWDVSDLFGLAGGSELVTAGSRNRTLKIRDRDVNQVHQNIPLTRRSVTICESSAHPIDGRRPDRTPPKGEEEDG